MLLLLMMAMMGLMFAVIVHFVLGVVADAVSDGNAGTIETVGDWTTWMEGVRRFSVAVYLASIALGLATIISVLRFQSDRIRELAQGKSGA